MISMATVGGGTTRANAGNVVNRSSGLGLDIESGLQKATEQTAQYLQEAKNLYEPYMKSGAQSLDEYMKLLLGGVSGLQTNDQNFKDMLALSEKNVMANKAVGGLLRSTGTAAALNDTNLKFQNAYYGNRLNQLLQAVDLGKYGTGNVAEIFGQMGDNQRGLAEALAQIQLEREGMQATTDAARESAATSKEIAETTGGLFGHGGFLGLGI